ncbi:MAG: tetratricopeptide repeat-containing sensor histidine kinase [Bacteroidetes bacterium]|nr:tetratricopeptide repeat-containing sensor histidine kinase [Bacteroidota bacterium]
MMTLLKYFALIFCFWGSTISQNLPDSVKSTISNYSPEEKIHYLNELCWTYRDQDPYYVIDLGMYAIELAEMSNYKKLISESKNYVGVGYRNLGRLNTAVNYFSQAFEIASELNDSIQIGFTYNNLCRVYLLKGEYSSAIEYAFNALKVFEAVGDERGIGYANLNLGRIYSTQLSFEKSLLYLKKSAEIRHELGDKDAEASTKANMAQVYLAMEEYRKALEIYDEILETHQAMNNKRGIAEVYTGKAEIYKQLKNYNRAMEFLSLALSLNKEMSARYGVVKNELSLGQIYMSINDLGKAESLFINVVNQSIEAGFTQQELETYQYLGRLYATQRNLDKAVLYLEKYNNLNESVFGQQITNTIADLETAHVMEKKESENRILTQLLNEKANRLWLLQIIGILVILLGVVFYGRYRAKSKANSLLKELNFTKDKFFRILAHELRNPFNALLGYTDYIQDEYDYIDDEEKKNIIDELGTSLHNLYFLLDNLLNWTASQVEEVRLNPEVVNLYEIVDEIESLFQGAAKAKRMTVVNSINKDLECFADKNMLRTVVRNLISNSFKFTPMGGIIEVKAEEKENEISVFVIDDGMGISAESIVKLFDFDTHFSTEGTNKEQGSGLGLILVKDFVEQNGGTVNVTSTQGKGCKVNFTIPKQP